MPNPASVNFAERRKGTCRVPPLCYEHQLGMVRPAVVPAMHGRHRSYWGIAFAEESVSRSPRERRSLRCTRPDRVQV